MGSFSPSQDPSPLGCGQQMMPSPQDDSLGSSHDGQAVLAHSMHNSSSMDVSLVSMEENASSPVMHAGRVSMDNEQQMYSPPATADANGLLVAMGPGDQVSGKKYHATTVNSNTNNNNNNYMLNNNNISNSNAPAEYGAHHSPQIMQQQQQQQHQLGEYNPMYVQVSPRAELSRLSPNISSNISHKIQVKCASELMHGSNEFPEGLRTNFKKEPEHRY